MRLIARLNWRVWAAGMVAAFGLAACGGGGEASPTERPQAKPGGGGGTAVSTSWQPPAGSTPASGNYVYLSSAIGDPVGLGKTYLHTSANAQINSTSKGTLLRVGVTGVPNWVGLLRVPGDVSGRLVKGSYTALGSANVNWLALERRCTSATAWLVVDSVSYNAAGLLTAATVRFEQQCVGASGALRGKLRWVAADMATPAGPLPFSPSDGNYLFPAAGDASLHGNYLKILGHGDDPLTQGLVQTYNGAGVQVSVSESASATTNPGIGIVVNVAVNGSTVWAGELRAMKTLPTWTKGYYDLLTKVPAHNPQWGGMNWQYNGLACTQLQGYFSIDELGRDAAGKLNHLLLRFNQACEPIDDNDLRGQLRWSASGQ